METIRWFCVSRSTDCLRVAQIAITKLEIHKLPSSWRLVKHLGSGGRTSHVYLVVENGNWSRLALKVPRPGFRLDLDIHYLNALAAVDGIPKVYQQINSMLAIQPVGEPFSCEDVTSYRAKGTSLSVADLVEILQYAHKRGIANRDLRPENIMIAESLHNKGEIRLFILDWGFATKIGQISAFSGSVVTASDCVLQQLRCGENEVVKMTAMTTSYRWFAACILSSILKQVLVCTQLVGSQKKSKSFGNNRWKRAFSGVMHKKMLFSSDMAL